MSKDKFRFDPKEDYRNWNDDCDNDRGNRGGFRPIHKGKKFKKDKYDGKRRNKFADDRW